MLEVVEQNSVCHVFGVGGETEIESQPPKSKSIQKFCHRNWNRKSAIGSESYSKFFCYRNRLIKITW